jgi:dihydroorotate dehydrogenase (NAD+) catalytic subunit
MVYQITSVVSIPVVGVGGVTCTEDALQYFMAGASAVQVGTANFVNPRTATEIIDGLTAYCQKHGIADISELVGVARPPAARPVVTTTA